MTEENSAKGALRAMSEEEALGIQRSLLRAAPAQDVLPQRPDSIYSQFHLDNWTDEDFAKHSAATRKTLAYLVKLEAAIRSPAASPTQDAATRDPAKRPDTPHWERRWPHDQPNGWNLDADKFLALIKSTDGMMWLALGKAKYIELRVDTRDCGFNLYDRDGQPLNPDEVVAAVDHVKKNYGTPSRSPAATSKPGWCQGADAICHHPACACVLPAATSKPVSELDFMNWFIKAGCTGMSVAQTAAAVFQNYDVRPK